MEWIPECVYSLHFNYCPSSLCTRAEKATSSQDVMLAGQGEHRAVEQNDPPGKAKGTALQESVVNPPCPPVINPHMLGRDTGAWRLRVAGGSDGISSPMTLQRSLLSSIKPALTA